MSEANPSTAAKEKSAPLLINNTPVFIGTSGYNHEDWKGTFAPADIHSYDMLSYYADKGYNFLEITFTFYRIPEPDKIRHILLRTGDRVRFSVRIPKEIVHNPSDSKSLGEFLRGIAPLTEAGLLECLYADYHSSYSLSKRAEERVVSLRKNLAGFRFFAELHNRTWYKERIFKLFRDNDIGLTVLDMPPIGGLSPYYPAAFNYAQYIKLYGRSPKWIVGEEKVLNYDYTDKELKKILADAADKSVTSKAVYIVFANVAEGCAPKNARRLAELLVGVEG